MPAASARCAATKSSSLGPSTRCSDVDIGGGNARLIGNAELQFPFPGTGVDRSLRWFAFVDGGHVFYQEGEKISVANELRYSAGIGMSWVSPIGPLKLSYAKPLERKGRPTASSASSSRWAPASDAKQA